MLYPQNVIEEVREQNDIVEVVSQYLTLKQKGANFFGLCPFHNESTPSLSVSPDKQLYHCFGCGESGNVLGFVMSMENMDFPEAVKFLADRAGVALPEPARGKEALEAERLRARLFAIHKAAGRFYYECLHSQAGRAALKYLEKRRISPAVQRKFGLGYSPDERSALHDHLKDMGFSDYEQVKSGLVIPDKTGAGYHDRFFNRLMFPILDSSGRVAGFGGRVLNRGEPKYLNSPETPIFNKSRMLYGLSFAKATRMKELILVEGYMDTLSLYQAGFKNTVAALGTALNRQHAQTLKKIATELILLYDSDEAGTRAALRAIPLLKKEGFRVRAAQVPDGKDPDEFIKSRGSAEFAKILAGAADHISFQIESLSREFNPENPEHRLILAEKAAELFSEIESPVEREIYAAETARLTGVSAGALEAAAAKRRGDREARFAAEADKARLRLYAREGPAAAVLSSKGADTAARELLFFCAMDGPVFEKLKAHISPEDFPEGVYRRAAELIFGQRAAGEGIFPAELVNHFTDKGEQKKAAGIFAREPYYPENLGKALTEEVRLIKRLDLNLRISRAESAEELKGLTERLKALEHIQIGVK